MRATHASAGGGVENINVSEGAGGLRVAGFLRSGACSYGWSLRVRAEVGQRWGFPACSIGFDLSLTNLAALEFVTIMSLLGQVFALGYLDKEWALARFYALLGFFEGAMAGVVLSSNLFLSYLPLNV